MATPVTPRPEPTGGDAGRPGDAAPPHVTRAPAPQADDHLREGPAPPPGDPRPVGGQEPALAAHPASAPDEEHAAAPSAGARRRPPGALRRSAPIDVTVPPPPPAEHAVRRPPAPLHGGPRTLLRFMRAHRMLTPKYVFLIARWAWLKLRWRGRLQTDGICFVAPTVKFEIGRNATVRLGRWCWIGHGTKVRAHEGVVDIGAKTVLGQECTISCFKHVSIGREGILADRVMLIDFDHGMVEVERPIREQGIYKREVRLGHNVWVGYGACFLRGVTVGDNAVVGTNAVVTADVPANAVVGGVPARLIRMRDTPELLRWE